MDLKSQCRVLFQTSLEHCNNNIPINIYVSVLNILLCYCQFCIDVQSH